MKTHAHRHWKTLRSYRTAAGLIVLLALAACSSSTETVPTRYNFAIVDGRNQTSDAGTAQLAKPITAQLTRDPSGKFATRVFDFFAPAVAYAQGLTLSGTPVANAIVCGRETGLGEPKVVPLCAYTLADGKAANSVQGGTKAGVYNILFTAQVPSQAPVQDSTTVTVSAGAAAKFTVDRSIRQVLAGSTFDLHPIITGVLDKYDNVIPTPYGFTPQYAVRDQTEPDGFNPTRPDGTGWTFTVKVNPTGNSVPDPSGSYKTHLVVFVWVPGAVGGQVGPTWDYFEIDVR